jgi:mRNA interferase RelE/StbE
MLGSRAYEIEYLPDVVDSDIPSLPSSARVMIKKAIEERLTVDPIGFGKPLRYSLKAHRRLRVNDYRIVYRIDATYQKVIIVAIKHRKEIYEDL